MNPNPNQRPGVSAPLPVAAAMPVQATLMTTRPPWQVSLLNAIGWAGVAIGLLLELLAYKDMVPAEMLPDGWGAVLGGSSGVLLAFMQFLEKVGDLLDDGKANGSYKLGQKAARVGALLLCGLLVSCGSVQQMSDTKLMLAKAGMQAAQIAFAAAGAVFLEKMSDPDTPAWQLQAASRGLDLAAKQLAEAEARYAREQARREALPDDVPLLTGGKTAASVVP